jgi:hypothetical protein
MYNVIAHHFYLTYVAFRMDRVAFDTLLQKVCTVMGDTTTSNVAQAIRSSGSAVAIETRLAIALRWLAGGSYWDISGLFGVSAGVFFHLACSLPLLNSLNKYHSNFNQGRFIVNVDRCGLRYTPSTRLYVIKSFWTYLLMRVVELQTASQCIAVDD